jgi:hypothetical protein
LQIAFSEAAGGFNPLKDSELTKPSGSGTCAFSAIAAKYNCSIKTWSVGLHGGRGAVKNQKTSSWQREVGRMRYPLGKAVEIISQREVQEKCATLTPS